MPRDIPRHTTKPKVARHKPTRHPFSGTSGQKFARAEKTRQFVNLLGICPMCRKPMSADIYSNHLDHIKPHKLRPDLSKDTSNLQIVCQACHRGTCASIEASLWPDADAIAEAKARSKEDW